MPAATASPSSQRLADGPVPRLVILHVTESYGAGTATAIQRFVRSVPEAEHHLLRRVRSDSSIREDGDLFVSVSDLPSPGVHAMRAIRRAAHRIAPTTVHLHSSIGGALGRAALGPRQDRTLVYSPHCYAFERKDLPLAARVTLRSLETLLSFNTTVTAACSPREAALARTLRPGARSVFVPNVAPRSRLRVGPRGTQPVVFSVGRAGAQKDPQYFARVSQEVRRARPDVRFLWIGGGDPLSEQSLRDAGVEVTGWLSALDDWPAVPADAVYLHTASWEGYPISILEAQAAGLPIAARRIAALAHLSGSVSAPDESDLARIVLRLLSDPESRIDNIDAWREEASRNSETRQREALLECYRARSSTS